MAGARTCRDTRRDLGRRRTNAIFVTETCTPPPTPPRGIFEKTLVNSVNGEMVLIRIHRPICVNQVRVSLIPFLHKDRLDPGLVNGNLKVTYHEINSCFVYFIIEKYSNTTIDNVEKPVGVKIKPRF